MKAEISIHQINQLLAYLAKEYIVYGPTKENGKIVINKISKWNDLVFPAQKSILPPKKFLYPDNQDIDQPRQDKIAFFGMADCDAKAIARLYNELGSSSQLPERKNLLVVSSTCKNDKYCFCTAFHDGEITDYDLHLAFQDKDRYVLYIGSKRGQKIAEILKLKIDKKRDKPKAIQLPLITKINEMNLKKAIENKDQNLPFWQEISENCFGCGACTAVCPLCFCTGKDFVNDTMGGCKGCLKWDSCFAKSFSEIQNHLDLRPSNTDRLYNWYHHKFVRAPERSGQTLCTGCGRCIKACPANLNQHNIIKHLESKN